MSKLTKHEQFIMDLQRTHQQQLETAQQDAEKAYRLLYNALADNRFLSTDVAELKEKLVEHKDQITKLKLTVRGVAVFSALGGAIVATILTTYAIWAINAL